MEYCVMVNIWFNRCKYVCVDEAVFKNYRYKCGNNNIYIQLTVMKYLQVQNLICNVLCGPEIYRMYCKCYVDVVVLS